MIVFRPSFRQRRAAMMRCATYFRLYAGHLWDPVRVFPVGLYPFGREPVPEPKP